MANTSRDVHEMLRAAFEEELKLTSDDRKERDYHNAHHRFGTPDWDPMTGHPVRARALKLAKRRIANEVGPVAWAAYCDAGSFMKQTVARMSPGFDPLVDPLTPGHGRRNR